jgi:hypothetical protein
VPLDLVVEYLKALEDAGVVKRVPGPLNSHPDGQ